MTDSNATYAIKNSVFSMVKKIIRCDVYQGSILGPLLFLIFANDLQNTTNMLNAIMFANNISFFPHIVT